MAIIKSKEEKMEAAKNNLKDGVLKANNEVKFKNKMRKKLEIELEKVKEKKQGIRDEIKLLREMRIGGQEDFVAQTFDINVVKKNMYDKSGEALANKIRDYKTILELPPYVDFDFRKVFNEYIDEYEKMEISKKNELQDKCKKARENVNRLKQELEDAELELAKAENDNAQSTYNVASFIRPFVGEKMSEIFIRHSMEYAFQMLRKDIERYEF